MTTAIVWFRQDLRIADNEALTYALKNYNKIVALYICDTQFWLGSASKWWLYKSLEALGNSINLTIRKGDSLEILKSLINELNVTGVFWNNCYDGSTIALDVKIKNYFQNIECRSFNSALLFEPWEIQTKSKKPFSLFTPFWKACLAKGVTKIPLPKPNVNKVIKLISDKLNFNPIWAKNFDWRIGEDAAKECLKLFMEKSLNNYENSRNIPCKHVTSRLSPHLHFGEISPLQIWYELRNHRNVDCFLSEIGWREFSYYLLYHYPKLPNQNLRKKFENFVWEENPNALKRWQQGLTGYPIVDAGMRQLWKTGWMHNRVRMIVASFLVKDLLIDWRKGASWFLDTLVDADLANNSVNWQWVAGSGIDASPFFRIFNPVLQGEKFDPDGEYVRKYIPEIAKLPNSLIHKPWLAPKKLLEEICYPKPIVNHEVARLIALKKYKSATLSSVSTN